jgi:uncharacterized membrane protein
MDERLSLVPSRLRYLDAARGAAMMFVFLSHFGDVYRFAAGSRLPDVLRESGLVATPTFVIISGMLIGYLATARRADFERIRVRFLDRGLFLLTVVHVLMVLGHVAHLGGISSYLFITDVVGLCMLIQPWVVTRVSARWRLVASAAIYAGSQFAFYQWHPAGWIAHAAKESLFGTDKPGIYAYAFPFLPWLSVDLAATVIGERVARLSLKNDGPGISRLILRIGLTLLSIGVAVAVLQIASRPYPTVADARSGFVRELFSLRKYPPSPVYLMCFGGLGLTACVWGMFRGEHVPAIGKLFTRLETMGRNSLVAFVVQTYVYYTLVYSLRDWLPAAAWLLVFGATLSLIVMTTLEFDRRDWQRWITMGFAPRRTKRSMPLTRHASANGAV